MELTLIPIAAILLLLSGARTPAHLAAAQTSVAELVCLWLSREEPESEQQTRARRPYVAVLVRAWKDRSLGAHLAETIATRVQLAVRYLRSRQWQTRFSVASAAYLATAPPQA